MDGQALLGQAEDIVKQAVAAGADDAEVYLEQGASMDVDVEADKLSSANSSQSRGGSVRLIKQGRLGFAYFSDPAQALAAIERALALSRLAPHNDYRLPEPVAVPSLASRWDDDLASLDVDGAVTMARDLITGTKARCADASVAGGGAGAGWGIEAIASSRGVAVWDRATHISVGAGVALDDGDTSLNAWDMEVAHQGTLDGAAVGAAIAETVDSLRDPGEAKGGPADVILLPDAASSLLGAGVLPAIDGDAAARGRSVWADSLGQAVADDGLSLRDDVTIDGALGATPFDGEGLGIKPTPLIDAGVLQTFVYDSWDAFQHGAKTTGHAVRGGFKAPPTTGIHHTVLSHKTTQSLDDLIGGVDHGYLVESVLGAHTANATTGDFSVTAPNVWRITSGAIVGACEAVAIAGNLPDMLRRVDAMSDEPRFRDGAVTPAVRFRDVAVSV